jgi:hypothetical protein
MCIERTAVVRGVVVVVEEKRVRRRGRRRVRESIVGFCWVVVLVFGGS